MYNTLTTTKRSTSAPATAGRPSRDREGPVCDGEARTMSSARAISNGGHSNSTVGNKGPTE